MLCEFGEILLIVAASCEQTIPNRVTIGGELLRAPDDMINQNAVHPHKGENNDTAASCEQTYPD